MTCVAVLAAGCGGGDSDTAGSVGPTSASQSTATVEQGSSQMAEVLLPVEPIVSAAGAVTGVIGPDAPLVLDTVGPRGAAFRAEFPQGATPVPVTVTMRPLESVGGMGAVDGVTFEPPGVYLAEPAVLTIDGPVANAGGSRAFGYQATGEGAAAFPQIVVPVSGPLQLVVGHFSGYGAVNESPTQWDIGKITAAEAREIIALEDWVIANTLQLLKENLLSDAEAQETINTALDAIATATQRLAAAALVEAETGSPSAQTQAEIAAAISVILQSQRADELSGRVTNRNAVAEAVAVMKTYLAGVTKHCQKAHDLTVLTLLSTLRHQLAVLGGHDEAADAEFRKCTNAEVHFLTTLTHEIVDGGGDAIFATGEIRLEASASVNLFDQLPSEVVAYTPTSTLAVHFPDCMLLTILGEGTFDMQRAALTVPPTPPPPPAGAPAPTTTRPPTPTTGPVVPPLQITDASVQFAIIGDAITNPGAACVPDPERSSPFSELYDALHPAEALGGGAYLFAGSYVIPGPGSEVLATRTIDREYIHGALQNDIYRTTTVIELIHKPG